LLVTRPIIWIDITRNFKHTSLGKQHKAQRGAKANVILKDTEWAGIGHGIEFIYFIRDTVQPEACFSFNLRISELLLQLQHLFVFLFLAREKH